MNLLFEPYRLMIPPSHFLFFAGEQVEGPAELFRGEGEETLEFDIQGMTAAQVGAKLQELYGPKKFEQVLREYVNRIYPSEGNPNIKEQLIADAVYGTNKVPGYKDRFDGEHGIYAAFTKAIEDLEDARDEALATIEDRTREALDKLHAKVELARKVVEKKPEVTAVPPYDENRSEVPIVGALTDGRLRVPILAPFLESVNIPIMSGLIHSREWIDYKQAQEKAENKFRDYLEAIFEEFMTPELDESDLGERLRAGMLMQAHGKINFLFREGKASKETLKELHQNIEARLNEVAALDGKPGDLSLEDAGRLLAQAPALPEDLIALVNRGSSDEILKALEARHALNPQDWVEATLMTTHELIAQAVRNGNQQGLIDAVNAYAQRKNTEIARQFKKGEAPEFKPITDFGEAANAFSNVMAMRAMVGVQETLDTFQEFNQAINGPLVELLEEVKPALKGMVAHERDRLLDGLSIPEPDSYDEAIVEFMRKDSREEREEILNDPDKRQRLFTAIQIIETDYAKVYKAQASNLPRKANELTTNPDASKPTAHDLLARVKAMMILAGESRWMVENFGEKKALEETEVVRRGKGVYEPNVNFRDVDKRYRIGYQSIAARSGFNFRDLGLSTLKVWGGATAFANVMDSMKEEGWENKVEAIVSNPFIYAGVGIVYGVDRYREDPRVAQLWRKSPGEKAEIVTHVRLNSLGRKVGVRPLQEFIQTESEWKVMRHLKPKDIQKLIEQAQKRNPRHPEITKKDLEEKVLPEDWVHLPDEGNDTKRFYFYSKLLQSESDIHELYEHCRSWL